MTESAENKHTYLAVFVGDSMCQAMPLSPIHKTALVKKNAIFFFVFFTGRKLLAQHICLQSSSLFHVGA